MTGVYKNISLKEIEIVCKFIDYIKNGNYKKYLDSVTSAKQLDSIEVQNIKNRISKDELLNVLNTSYKYDIFYTPSRQKIHWYWERNTHNDKGLMFSIVLDPKVINKRFISYEIKYKSDYKKYREGINSIYIGPQSDVRLIGKDTCWQFGNVKFAMENIKEYNEKVLNNKTPMEYFSI